MGGTSHSKAGIVRSVSEPVYAKDILSEITLVMAPPAVKGAWAWVLFTLWENGGGRLTGTYEEMGRLWGCDKLEARKLSREIQRRKIGDVTLRHDSVTIVSRRLWRREKERIQARNRKTKERQSKCHADVTDEKQLPSSSSSFSPSPSGNIGGGKRPLSVLDLKDKLSALNEMLPQLQSSEALARKNAAKIKQVKAEKARVLEALAMFPG